MKLDSKFLITNQKQIFNHFTNLQQNKCLFSIKSNANADAIITTLLQIDEKDHFLILDYGPKEFQNKQLIKAKSPEFISEFEGIKLIFFGKEIKKTRVDGQVVFSMPLPSSIYWIQRRDCYRVKIPLSHRSYCQVRYLDGDDELKYERFKLLDISASGMAFHDDRMAFANDLISSQAFIHCKLYLDEQEINEISFDIVNKLNLFNNKPSRGKRIGCQFNNLSPATESLISRYMQDVEREQRNLGQ